MKKILFGLLLVILVNTGASAQSEIPGTVLGKKCRGGFTIIAPVLVLSKSKCILKIQIENAIVEYQTNKKKSAGYAVNDIVTVTVTKDASGTTKIVNIK